MGKQAMIETPVSLPRNDLKITQKNASVIRSQWVRAVEKLIEEAAQWANAEPNWTVTRGEKEIEEEKIGAYQVPTLKIVADAENYLVLEPVARQSWRGNGEVDLWAYPTYLRVRLMRDETANRWFIRTESGIDWPFVLKEEVFVDIAKRLLDAP